MHFFIPHKVKLEMENKYIELKKGGGTKKNWEGGIVNEIYNKK